MMKCSCGFIDHGELVAELLDRLFGAQHPHVAGGAGHLAGFAQHALEAFIAGEQARGDEIVADRHFGLAGVEPRIAELALLRALEVPAQVGVVVGAVIVGVRSAGDERAGLVTRPSFRKSIRRERG